MPAAYTANTEVLRGLTTAEVTALRKRHGPNSTPPPTSPSLWKRIGSQLRDPLILLLLAAMVVTALLRDVTDLIVIGMVIVLNTTVGIIQEIRADQAVAALQAMSAPHARVIRNSTPEVIPAADLVPGDVVNVEAGDIVPADLSLVGAARLATDESALTGESLPVDKTTGDELSGGTVVTTGRGTGLVTRTGTHSALGQITALVSAQPRRLTPLQLRLAGLSRILGIAIVAVSALVLVLGVVAGRPFLDMVLVAVSLTVAAVPESLPAVVTVALALGAARMARRAAIVRHLPAVETLGSVTVLAADKTGTLTEGIMSVEYAICDETLVAVHGRGYDPDGVVEANDIEPDRFHRLAQDVLLCNDADLAPPEENSGPWQPIGDPMEAALVAFAARCGIEPGIRNSHPRISEIPFDAIRRRMSTVHVDVDTFLVVCKGAPEAVLTEEILTDPPETISRATALAVDLAAQGYRVLAVADAHRPVLPPSSRIESGLKLVGLVALGDPIREQAADAARLFAEAGIRLILITGDHPATARSIASQVGIIDDDGAVLMGEDPLTPERLDNVRVFARTHPEGKLAIVTALQERGEVVAMTGDGVNDAPALRRADIGVAMGRGGTEAARQAGDLVLADDNLGTAGIAVVEGRRIYANIRRFLGYALAGGLAEVLVMLTGPWMGLAIPLLPAQILWINMLTHGLPGVALGAEPGERDVMRQPPRRPDEAILGAGLTWQIGSIGTLIAVMAMGTALMAHDRSWPWQSMLFTVLGLAQLGVALAVRATRVRGEQINWWLPAALVLSLAGQLGALWWAPLRELLGTQPLNGTQLLVCAIAAAVPGTALATFRKVRSHHQKDG